MDSCYGDFRDTIQDSDKNFRSLSDKTSECLIEINDVLHEIRIIKQVLNHRASFWETMHNIPPRGQKTQEHLRRWALGKNEDFPVCSWKVTNCNPIAVRDASYSGTDAIEKQAPSVKNKVRAHGQHI